TLRRSMVVAGGWSLIAIVAFALFFQLGGQGCVSLQTDIPEVRATAMTYLPYLALMPLLALWSYLLDGLFIGATRAREKR
ncbi:MATE family efflux transporter, partial [Pseudomonas syringae pv. tagetis]